MTTTQLQRMMIMVVCLACGGAFSWLAHGQDGGQLRFERTKDGRLVLRTSTTTGGSNNNEGETGSTGGDRGGSSGSGGSGGQTGNGTGSEESQQYLEQITNGWTDFTPSANTRIFYVSSSEGDDANDGRSPQDAFRSLDAAYAAVRDGMPDWILLKRGDTWEDQAFPMWKKSGESDTARMMIGTYGEGPRPRILTGDVSGFRTKYGESLSHIAIVGIELFAHRRQGDETAIGIDWVSTGRDLLIEDCYIHGYKDNVVVQDPVHRSMRDVVVRRSIIADSFSTRGHSQGFYASYTSNILLEESLFDHNGWKEGVPGAEPTIFNHNVYIQNSCSDFVMKECVVANASSHGVQARPGGAIVRSVFYRNPISILLGGGDHPNADGVEGIVRWNIFLNGNDISRDHPRGHGMTVSNVRSAVIRHNTFAFDASDEPYGHAMYFDGEQPDEIGVHGVECASNLMYNWRGGIKFRGRAGSDITGIIVRDNVIQDLGTFQTLVMHSEPVDPSEFDYANNVYYSNGSTNRWFQIDRVPYGFQHWVAQANEASAVTDRVELHDPDRSMARFAEAASAGSAAEDYLHRYRRQHRGNWRWAFSSDALRGYFEEGFHAETTGSVDL